MAVAMGRADHDQLRTDSSRYSRNQGSPFPLHDVDVRIDASALEFSAQRLASFEYARAQTERVIGVGAAVDDVSHQRVHETGVDRMDRGQFRIGRKGFVD